MRFSWITGTIGRKLGASFALLLILVIVGGIVASAGIASIETAARDNINTGFQINDLIKDAALDLRTVEQLTALYLANYDQIGLEEARTRYLDGISTRIAGFQDALGQVGGLKVSEEAEFGEDIDNTVIDRAIDESRTYQALIERLVSLLERRGVENEGYIGAFEQAAAALQAQVDRNGNLRLRNTLLEMRRAEKNYLLYGGEEYLTEIRSLTEEFKSRFETQDALTYQSQGVAALVDGYLANFEALYALDAEVQGAIGAAQDMVDQIGTLTAELETIAHDDVAEAQGAIFDRVRAVRTLLVISIAGTALLGIGFAVMATRSITRPLGHITGAAQRIAAGDLDGRVQIRSQDEIGVLGQTFNRMAEHLQQRIRTEQTNSAALEQAVASFMAYVQQVADGDLSVRLDMAAGGLSEDEQPVLFQLGASLNAMTERLREMTQQVHDTASRVFNIAAEILAGTTQQAASATEQDAAVTQTMATVEQVRVTVGQTAERALAVVDVSRQSVDVSRLGQDAVADTIGGMQMIRQRVEDIAATILTLSERMQQIGEIINSVNDIAEQSKLLALNASIEAARAGEEGRGFAVVAMEVRQLAEQSRQLTGRVRDILEEIQQTTNTAVMVTEEGIKGADHGGELVNRAGAAINDLAQIIEAAMDAVSQIAASASQQINGMDQLTTAMISIKQATHQATASNRQSEQSAQQLNEMANRLATVVARYRL